ncbi:hypothetical protein FHX74_000971 [Friedmanniella endophytica]|uniref:Uncharacterized protein n=1 Tax=Microlunatus kandeliicorticis TaxID=1759536 RepID=A0A7W3P4X6_9ACTN|nr:hypothetical protein [Microlunatus kandeliicorticis]MBA8793366.1 hypothetical protein [Microlunatus kandeliicorticis]
MSERPWQQGPGPGYTYGPPAVPPAPVPPPVTVDPVHSAGYGDTYAPGFPPAPAYPVPVPNPYAVTTGQRPAVIAMSASMAVTGSVGFLVLLALSVLVALSVVSTFSYTQQPEAAVYHLAERFELYLADGLALPLVGFPLASTVTGFLLIARRPWARIAHTAVGLAALAWSAWWLRDHLAFWVPTTVYIALAVAILWVPAVGRWYASRPAGAVRPPR